MHPLLTALLHWGLWILGAGALGMFLCALFIPRMLFFRHWAWWISFALLVIGIALCASSLSGAGMPRH